MDIQGIIALIAVICMAFYLLRRDIKMMRQKHDVKYTLKTILKYTQVIIGTFISANVVYIGVVCISAFSKYLASAEIDGFIYNASTLTIAILTMGLVFFIIILSTKQFIWKLTNEEKEFEKNQATLRKLAWQSRIEKYPKFIRLFLK